MEGRNRHQTSCTNNRRLLWRCLLKRQRLPCSDRIPATYRTGNSTLRWLSFSSCNFKKSTDYSQYGVYRMDTFVWQIYTVILQPTSIDYSLHFHFFLNKG